MKKNIYSAVARLILFILVLSPALLNAQAIKDSIRKNYTLQDYEKFLMKEKLGEIPKASGRAPSTGDGQVNNNTGASGTQSFTQSETSVLSFGNHVIVGFNDAGSLSGGANKFTGFSYSSDGGLTFTDGGTLPTNAGGDAGDPVLARNESTGRIYFSTLGFSITTIQVFHSDDNGITWSAPVNGTPGGIDEDKQWIAVDNFAGPGNGNVYLISRRFAGTQGIYMFRSTDNGNTFGPNGGVPIVAGMQGAYVTVGPDHAVYAFWFNGTTIQMRKSTDFGLSFSPAVTVVSGLDGPQTNGGLALTGIRQGLLTSSGFRSNSFPHVAVNPVSGHLYLTFNDNPAGTDKGDIYLVMSTDGGATWSPRILINDDGTTTDQWQPTIAVSPNGTNIGIFYFSRQDDATNNNLFTYNARTGIISGSTITFLPGVVVSDVQSLPEFGRDAVVNTTYMGDYNMASATATEFHVVWSDNRSDLAGGSPRKDPNVYHKSIPIGLLPGPNIAVSPVNINFGYGEVNQTKGPVKVTLTNIGDADLTISSISDPGTAFSVTSASTLPVVLPSLGTVILDVAFTPTNVGQQNSDFIITSDAVNTPSVSVSLSGSGLTAPPNDLCENAVALDCGSIIGGYTYFAEANLAPTCNSVSNTSPGVWYTITGNGYPITLATCTASDFDTKISVYSGSCDALSCVGANDNSCGTGSEVTFPTLDGTVYYVLVHGSGNQQGTFTLTAFCSPEIEVSPASLTFNVPVNGSASQEVTLSNPAGSKDLVWTIFGSEEALSPNLKVSGSGSPAPDNEVLRYKVTNGTVFSLLSQNVPQDVVHGLTNLTGTPAANLNIFEQTVISAIGEENTFLFLPLIMEYSLYTVPETGKPVKGIQHSVEDGSDATVGGIESDGSGGPDAANYTWIDSDEPGGPVFNWTDITSTGTPLVLGDDASVLVSLPFNFSFYGNVKTEVRVSSNGYLTFGTAGSSFSNAGIPNAAAPNDIICPFWDDLNPASGGTIHYISDPAKFVVQYTGIPRFGTSLPNTFQVILNQDGSIIFQYLDMQGLLNSASVGIENITGSTGLQIAYNATYLHNNLAVKISQPAACPWITSISPNSGTVSGGGTQSVTVNVDAIGLTSGTYDCHLTIYSNAANANKVDVPVTLIVGSLAVANVSLTWNNSVYNCSPNSANGFAYGVGGVEDVLSPGLTFSYEGVQEGGIAYGPSPDAPSNAGVYTVTASFAGNSEYQPASTTESITISKATPTVAADWEGWTYDCTSHAASATVTGACDADILTATLSYEGVSPTVYPASSSPPVNSGTYKVTASFNGNNNYNSAIGEKTVTVTPYSVCDNNYNGDVFVNTNSTTGGSATIMLSITIPAAGSCDVGSSSFAFTLDPDPSSGITKTPGTLSRTLNSGIWTFSQPWTINLGTNLSTSILVDWTFTGNYSNSGCGDQNTIVTVSAPASDFASGGGFIILTDSYGTKAGYDDTKNNFGFNVKWAKNYTRLTGNFNTIWRQDGDISFRARSNKPSSMKVTQVPGSNPAKYQADIVYSNVNIQQLCESCWSDGNGTVILTVRDLGEPASGGNATADQIGFAVKDKNGVLIFSTNVYSVSASPQTVLQNLAGGNIQVKPAKLYSAESDAPVVINEDSEFSLLVYPNPSSGPVNFRFSLAEDAKVTLEIYNAAGVLTERIFSDEVQKGTEKTAILDKSIPAGTYMFVFKYGDKVETGKFIITTK